MFCAYRLRAAHLLRIKRRQIPPYLIVRFPFPFRRFVLSYLNSPRTRSSLRLWACPFSHVHFTPAPDAPPRFPCFPYGRARCSALFTRGVSRSLALARLLALCTTVGASLAASCQPRAGGMRVPTPRVSRVSRVYSVC